MEFKMNPRGELSILQLLITLLVVVAFVAGLLVLLIKFRTPVDSAITEYNTTTEKIIDLFGY